MNKNECLVAFILANISLEICIIPFSDVISYFLHFSYTSIFAFAIYAGSITMGIIAICYSRKNKDITLMPYRVFNKIAFPVAIVAIVVASVMAVISGVQILNL